MLIHSLNIPNSQDWTRLELRARIYIQVSLMGGRGTGT